MNKIFELDNLFPLDVQDIEISDLNSLAKSNIFKFNLPSHIADKFHVPKCFDSYSFYLLLAQSLIEHEYVTRSTFPMLTEQQYRMYVRGSNYFSRIARGKYIVVPGSELDKALDAFVEHMSIILPNLKSPILRSCSDENMESPKLIGCYRFFILPKPDSGSM